MRPRRPRLAIVMFALLLAACATPVGTTIQPSAAHLDKYNDLSALDVVTSLEKNVNEAKAAGMPFLEDMTQYVIRDVAACHLCCPHIPCFP